MSKEIALQPGDNILVSRTDRLGDLILALPLVETLKERYPECNIHVLSSLYASPILENNPRIDKIVRVQNDQMFTDKLYKKDLMHRIRLGNYKVVVVLYPERQISRLFYKAGIPIRIGTAGRFHSVFFNTHLFHSRKENKKHELEYNLDFLQFFRNGNTVLTPQVYLKEKEIRNARRILANAGVESPFVIIHPGSGGSADQWPLEFFLRLYTKLVEDDVSVVISGSEKEGLRFRGVLNQIDVPVKEITGGTDLRTLAAVLSLADVVVANSTGPLHLAAAVGTKVVGLYPSKRIMSPVRWGPVGPFHRVLQPSRKDCHCPDKQCRCMETITVENVAEQVVSLLTVNVS